jgi:hypothetical protein
MRSRATTRGMTRGGTSAGSADSARRALSARSAPRALCHRARPRAFPRSLVVRALAPPGSIARADGSIQLRKGRAWQRQRAAGRRQPEGGPTSPSTAAQACVDWEPAPRLSAWVWRAAHREPAPPRGRSSAHGVSRAARDQPHAPEAALTVGHEHAPTRPGAAHQSAERNCDEAAAANGMRRGRRAGELLMLARRRHEERPAQEMPGNDRGNAGTDQHRRMQSMWTDGEILSRKVPALHVAGLDH